MFGDRDPFDAWDDGDALAVRLRRLARIVDRVGEFDEARRAIVRRLAAKVAADLGRL